MRRRDRYFLLTCMAIELIALSGQLYILITESAAA